MSSATNSQQQNALATHARMVALSPAQSQQLQQVQQAQQSTQGTGCNWWDIGCLLNATFAPVGQLTAFLNPLWQWIQNPVRVVKMIGGILALGVGLLLLIKPEALPDIPGVKT